MFLFQFLPVPRTDHTLQDRRFVHEHRRARAEEIRPVAGGVGEEEQSLYPY